MIIFQLISAIEALSVMWTFFVCWTFKYSLHAFKFCFQTLEKLSPMIERNECNAATDSGNMQKSRFRNILPADRFRPKLLTPVDGCNDFINAVFLPVSFYTLTRNIQCCWQLCVAPIHVVELFWVFMSILCEFLFPDF